MKTHNVKQRTEEWYALRLGLPTASEFSNILTPKTLKLSKSINTLSTALAADIFTGKTDEEEWEGNYHTQRGQRLEPDAITRYEFAKNCTVDLVGFVTNDEGTYGCSPDGLVGTDGGIEIKCLKAENHIKAIIYFEENQKMPPEYMPQVQGQLMITGRKWWDSIFYHPSFPLLIVRNSPDKKVQELLLEGIEEVIQKRDSTLSTLNKHNKEEKWKSND
tara:strand:- start:2197 stop:2850 length:654 start_codon:yes stop_codon:yes gene_type:complete